MPHYRSFRKWYLHTSDDQTNSVKAKTVVSHPDCSQWSILPSSLHHVTL